MKNKLLLTLSIFAIAAGLFYDGKLNSETIAGLTATPAYAYYKGINSDILYQLSQMVPSTNKMIYVNNSGILAQTSINSYSVGMLGITDDASARTYFGAGTSNFSGAYADLTGKPTLFSGAYTDLTGKPTIPTLVSQLSNDSAFLNQAGARSSVSLTTTGTSGNATYSSSTGVFNIPNYTYTLPSVGTAGTYSSVTTDAQGRVTAGTVRTWNNTPARSIVTGTGATGFQPSTTKDTIVHYGLKVTTTSTIVSGQEGYITLEVAPTNSATASDWVGTGAVCGNGQTFSLAVAIQGVQTTYCELETSVPAGYYAKIRSVNVTGTPTYTYFGGKEMNF